jgi:hypothetical protein
MENAMNIESKDLQATVQDLDKLLRERVAQPEQQLSVVYILACFAASRVLTGRGIFETRARFTALESMVKDFRAKLHKFVADWDIMKPLG